MFTTCPACQTVFRVTAATLRAAHGQVRCATCNTTFDALFGLSDEPPPGAVGSVRSLPPPVETPAEAPVEKLPAAVSPPVETVPAVEPRAPEPEPDPEPQLEPEPTAPAQPEPVASEPEPLEPALPEPELPAAESPATTTPEPADEVVVDDLPANPSLDQVAAALADAGVLLEELDDPSALDEVTLVHIPGDPYPAITAGTPSVAQALAEDAARNQRRAAMEAPVQALPATQVDLDDDAPTGTWAPLNLSAKAAPAAEPHAETGAAPASFAATLAAVSAAPATHLQGEPWFTNEGATAGNHDGSSVDINGDINGGLNGGLNGGMGEAAVEADAEEALEPWMDETQPSRRLGWAWTLGSVALLLVLAAQALHHWREPLARHPTLGSGVIALYAALGQPLSPALNLLAYTVTEGRVDAAAEPGALRVSAIITNRTGKPQARPLLQVTLEDRYGAPIGRRAFHPEEYVAAPAIGAATTGTTMGAANAIPQLPPRGVLPVAVEVADPGNEAVGFKLDICLEAAGVLHCSSDPVDGSAATTP